MNILPEPVETLFNQMFCSEINKRQQLAVENRYYDRKSNPTSERIRIRDLCDHDEKFHVSHYAEKIIFERLQEPLGLDTDVNHPVGYNAKYDIKVRLKEDVSKEIPLEIKFCQTRQLPVEVANYRNEHSGLILSQAQVYICINVQHTIAKIRAIQTQLLRKWVISQVIERLSSATDAPLGAYFDFQKNERHFPHIWLGDFRISGPDKDLIIDLSRLLYQRQTYNLTRREKEFRTLLTD